MSMLWEMGVPGLEIIFWEKKHRILTLNKTRNKPGNPVYLNRSYGYFLVRYVGISPVFKRLSKHGYIYICKNPDASKVSILRTWTPGIQVQTPPLKGPVLLRDVEIYYRLLSWQFFVTHVYRSADKAPHRVTKFKVETDEILDGWPNTMISWEVVQKIRISGSIN